MLLLLPLLRQQPTTGAVAASGPALRTANNWGVSGIPDGDKHWAFSDKGESLIIQHNLTDPDHLSVGLMTNFWLEAGRGGKGRYICDTLIIRVYVDGEVNASLAFTPAMAAGS